MRALATTEVVAQIAALSGVHVSTVWRALADDVRISAATRQRVRRHANALNYRPNLIARQLASGRSRTIGLVTSRVTSESQQKKLDALRDKIFAAGYDLLLRIVDLGIDAEIDAINDLRSRRVEGLLLITQATAEDNAHIKALQAEGVPHVLFDNTCDLSDVGTCLVSLDRSEVLRLSLACLTRLGHRRIAYLNSLGDAANLKVDAYNRLMRERGLIPLEFRLDGHETRHLFGYQVILQHQALLYDVTALIAHCDRVAMGALRALHELGMAIPKRISVIGFDNDDVGEVAIPPLTTIAHPIEAMTNAAIDLLMARIRDPRTPAERRLRIKPALVMRQSVGPAPVRIPSSPRATGRETPCTASMQTRTPSELPAFQPVPSTRPTRVAHASPHA